MLRNLSSLTMPSGHSWKRENYFNSSCAFVSAAGNFLFFFRIRIFAKTLFIEDYWIIEVFLRSSFNELDELFPFTCLNERYKSRISAFVKRVDLRISSSDRLCWRLFDWLLLGWSGAKRISRRDVLFASPKTKRTVCLNSRNSSENSGAQTSRKTFAIG